MSFSSVGLILEGGAMRGLYTAGILDVLMENGITFGGTVGVSAGACFGCNIKSGQIGRAIRYNKQYSRDWRYCSIRSLLKTGDLYGADFCYHLLPEELDPFDAAAFQANPMRFWVVATDVDTGRPVYLECKKGTAEDLIKIQASASMPVASRPVLWEGHRYLDGGISDSIPLKFMENQGFRKNVVILTQPEDFIKKPSPQPMISMLKDMPMIRLAMAHRHELYNASRKHVDDQVRAGKVFAFYPEKPLPIHHMEHSTKAMQTVYDMGYDDAVRRLDDLIRFMRGDDNDQP